MSTLQKIPRTSVRAGLAAARLPLTTAEAVLGHRGDDEWPPAMAFEGIEATVKQVAGSLLRDEALTEEGRLVQAKLERLRAASNLEVAAERTREQSAAELDERRRRNERREAEAERRAEERKARAERDAAARKRKADEEARRKERAAEKAAEATRKAVEREDRRQRSAALAAEKRALAKERAATTRSAQAKATDARIEASKARRSDGS